MFLEVREHTAIAVTQWAKSTSQPPFTPLKAGTNVRGIDSVARGTVLHLPSKSVVAASFVRFNIDNPYSTPTPDRFKFVKKQHDAAKPAAINYTPLVRGTIKLDGSMVVAYLWEGKIHTNTKRRHNSEQAVWARRWLHERIVDGGGYLRQGWTYVFEAVYRDNQIVMKYPFDSLVLLAAFNIDGCEIVDLSKKQHIASEVGVPLVPHLYGTLELFDKYQADKEGWVIERSGVRPATVVESFGGASCSDVVRSKHVFRHWKDQACAILKFTPRAVWEELRCTLDLPYSHRLRMNAALLPNEYKLEWNRMSKALRTRFDDALAYAPRAPPAAAAAADVGNEGRKEEGRKNEESEDEQLAKAIAQSLRTYRNKVTDKGEKASANNPCIICGCSAEVDAEGERICFCSTCRESGCFTEAMKHGCVGNYCYKNETERKLAVYLSIKPVTCDEVPGYVLPVFMRNNFAKGWPVPRNDGASPLASVDLTTSLALKVIGFLALKSRSALRLISGRFSDLVHLHFAMEFEIERPRYGPLYDSDDGGFYGGEGYTSPSSP